MNISKTCTAYTHMLEHIKIHTKMLLIIMSNHAVNSESSTFKMSIETKEKYKWVCRRKLVSFPNIRIY